MLNDSKTGYYYEDDCMYFWFGNTHSSKYRLFIVNNNDLTIEGSFGASTEFTNAMFQEGSYLLGTSRNQKTIKRKVATEGLTLHEYKNMMAWLLEGNTGWLSFDSNPYWGWTVVLESVSDANILYNNNTIIAEFELNWKTIGSCYASNRYDSTLITDLENKSLIVSNNEYGVPSIIQSYSNSNEFNILSIGTIYQSILSISGIIKGSSVSIKLNDTTMVDLTSEGSILQNLSFQYQGSGLILIDGIFPELHPKTSLIHNIGQINMYGLPPIIITNDNVSEIYQNKEAYKNMGYNFCIHSNQMSDSAKWNDPSGDNTSVRTHQVRPYTNPPSVVGNWDKITLCHSNKLTITGLESIQIQIKCYNNI